jgi:hypothetical protein
MTERIFGGGTSHPQVRHHGVIAFGSGGLALGPVSPRLIGRISAEKRKYTFRKSCSVREDIHIVEAVEVEDGAGAEEVEAGFGRQFAALALQHGIKLAL